MIRHFGASFLIPVSEQRSVLDNKQKANRFPLPSLPTEFRVSLSLRKQCKPESTTNLSLFVRHDCYRLSGCKYGSLRTNLPFVTIFTILHPPYTQYKRTTCRQRVKGFSNRMTTIKMTWSCYHHGMPGP